jgi:hypothetical protein
MLAYAGLKFEGWLKLPLPLLPLTLGMPLALPPIVLTGEL